MAKSGAAKNRKTIESRNPTAPMLITEGLRFLEKSTRQPPENPLAGLRGTIMAGCSLVAGAILVAFDGPWPLWSMLFALALVLALRRVR